MKNTKKKASRKAVKEIKNKSIKTSKTKTNKPKITPKNKTISKTNKTIKSKTVLKPKKEVKTKTVNIKNTPDIKSDAVKNEKTTSKSSITQKNKNIRNDIKQKNDENKLYVFRIYKRKQGMKKEKHPKLIVDATKTEYGHLGLTESNKNGSHNNIPIKNPQKKKKGQKDYKEISYLRKDLTYDKKSNYGGILKDYALNKEDEEYVKSFVERKISNKK